MYSFYTLNYYLGYSKCVRFKLDIYGSILCIFDTCNRTQLNEKKNAEITALHKTSKLNSTNNITICKNNEKSRLAEMMDDERSSNEEWSKYFESMTAEIVDTISSDITYAPLTLKVEFSET